MIVVEPTVGRFSPAYSQKQILQEVAEVAETVDRVYLCALCDLL